MKTKTIFIGVLLGFSVLVSCNNSDKSNSGESKSTGEGLFGGKDEKKEAGEIIKFNNAIVKVDNSQNSAIRTFTTNFSGLEEYVKSKIENPDGFTTIPPMMIFPPTIHNLKGIVYPDGKSKEFKPLIDQMDASFDAIKEINKEVDAYKSAEDWKEDKGLKLAEWKEKATAEIKKYHDASDQVYSKLSPLAAKAEEITLEGNPLKDQYLRSKRALNMVENATSMVFENQDLRTMVGDYKLQYDELDKVYKENKSDEIAKEHQDKVRTYGLFNDALNEYLGKMRIAQRELDAGNQISEGSLKSLENGSDNVLRSYNSFVD